MRQQLITSTCHSSVLSEVPILLSDFNSIKSTSSTQELPVYYFFCQMISLLIWFCGEQQDMPALQFILNKSNQRCYFLILWALLYLILWNFPFLTGSSSSGQKLWKWQRMITSGDTWMCWLYHQRNKILLYDSKFCHLAPDSWQTPECFGSGWNLFLLHLKVR